MSKIVYFDNNATTQVAPEVRDAMAPFFGELYGNPSSMHAFGGQVAKHVEKAREQVAAFFNRTRSTSPRAPRSPTTPPSAAPPTGSARA